MSHAFGRLIEHDPLSRNFAHPERAFVKKTTLWAHRAPVLDQGQVGSCTGNALAQCLNTDYFTAPRNRYLDEHDALLLYSKATRLDPFPGHYPPDDTGSSGNAVCKAGRALGYLQSWKWTFSFTSFLSALQTQPLIVGTAFYEGMENPDSNGLVELTGQIVGWHEYVALGVDYAPETLTFLNSWGADWGINGRFRMRFADFAMLQTDQGDVTVPIGK
jgi:hypothetical protein